MSDGVNRCITGRFQCIKGNFPFFKPKYILESQLITFEPSCFKTTTSYIKKQRIVYSIHDVTVHADVIC